MSPISTARLLRIVVRCVHWSIVSQIFFFMGSSTANTLPFIMKTPRMKIKKKSVFHNDAISKFRSCRNKNPFVFDQLLSSIILWKLFLTGSYHKGYSMHSQIYDHIPIISGYIV